LLRRQSSVAIHSKDHSQDHDHHAPHLRIVTQDGSGGAKAVEIVVLLLTRNTLKQPDCLFETYLALRRGICLIPIFVERGGYDYATGAAMLEDLPSVLAADHPAELRALQQALSDVNATVKELHMTLRDALPSIIAISWNPCTGHNHTASVIEDVQRRAKFWHLQREREKALERNSRPRRGLVERSVGVYERSRRKTKRENSSSEPAHRRSLESVSQSRGDLSVPSPTSCDSSQRRRVASSPTSQAPEAVDGAPSVSFNDVHATLEAR
jgi:hypothetical protein